MKTNLESNLNKIILALGSNINPTYELGRCLNLLKSKYKLSKISKVYITESLLKDDQEDYMNMVVEVYSDIDDPILFLKDIKNIEKEMGRIKKSHWGERTIDIDIIDFNGRILSYDELNIPHKEMINRSFVLYPLKDVAPDYIHPVYNKSIDILITELEDDLGIKVSDISIS